MENELFKTAPLWFMDCLNLAESMFGERDKSWTFIGIEYKEDGPYIMYYPQKRISIVLSTGSLSYKTQFLFQLSHEVCHLLYPTGKNNANNLNEGISAYFSYVYLRNIYPGSTYAIENLSKSKYSKPFNTIKEIIEKNAYFVTNLRLLNPSVTDITKEQIMKTDSTISDATANYLVLEF